MTAREPDYADRVRLEQEIVKLHRKITSCDGLAERQRRVEQFARVEAVVGPDR